MTNVMVRKMYGFSVIKVWFYRNGFYGY